MKTTVTPKKQDIERKWYLIDAQDKILGRLSVEIANILRGKNKPCFTPNIDCGDFVVVINAKKVKLTGNKLDNKKYYRHSGYKGSLKSQTAREKLEKKPEEVLKIAVRGMLPKNKLRKPMLKKLKIFAGEKHTLEAQKPVKLEI